MRQTYSEYHDPDERLGLVGEDRAEEFSRPDRRLPTIFLSVLAMALFAGGLWFAYVQGARHPAVTASGDAVPLIRADERPTKVKPDQPGGMPVPDQNVSLYNEKPGGPPVEKLLAPPEQPMPRPAPAAKDSAAKEAAAILGASSTAKTGTTATASGPVRVQLGSLRSAEAA